MDEGLEQQRRYLHANPDDPDAWPRAIHTALRADKLDLARGLIAELEAGLERACEGNVYARAAATPLGPLGQAAAPVLDLAAAVLARGQGDGLPYFEAAAEAPGDHRYAAFALRALLEDAPERALERPARLASAALRRDAATRRLAHDALAPLAPELPLSARLALACIAREDSIAGSPLLQDAHRGVRALAAARAQDPAIPRPIAARGAPEIENQPGRGFGAHGPDYSFGPFLGLRTRLEHRMQLFDIAFMDELRGEIGRIAERFHIPAPVFIAFSEGYGFAWDDDHQPEEKSIEALIRVLNAQQIYPGELRFGGRRPFDPLDDDEALARRFYRDFHYHPANRRLFWSSPVMRVVHAVGSTPKDQDIPSCEDDLARARELYTAPAATALERFYRTIVEMRARARRRLPFHED